MPSADVSGLDEEDNVSMRDVPDGQRGFASTESNDQLKTVITVDPVIQFEVDDFTACVMIAAYHSLGYHRSFVYH